MKNKIISVVKFNDGEAFVFKKKLKLIYHKYDNSLIIGTDGIIVHSYFYEKPVSERWKCKICKEKYKKRVEESTNDFIFFYLNLPYKGKLPNLKFLRREMRYIDKVKIEKYIKEMPYKDFLNTLYWRIISEGKKKEVRYKC
jgi:hypothetical protein